MFDYWKCCSGPTLVEAAHSNSSAEALLASWSTEFTLGSNCHDARALKTHCNLYSSFDH